MKTSTAIGLALVLGSLTTGCGGTSNGMMGPGGVGASASGATFMSVAPQGGAAGVSTSGVITFRFGAAMGAGMEQFVDLHRGDLGGPTVPMNFAWSADRTTLICTPQASLTSGTRYVVHLGGGMTTRAGQPLDYAQYGPMMGGQWIQGGMMGASHGGSGWGMMGSGWQNSNGSYGMAFTFTTA
ncbi:MAG: Ig-like domain-containing protein [Vicinamibacteria bacterium]|nr:Ig-like domain-containing protein [Vicinamibacteria bacterium]